MIITLPEDKGNLLTKLGEWTLRDEERGCTSLTSLLLDELFKTGEVDTPLFFKELKPRIKYLPRGTSQGAESTVAQYVGPEYTRNSPKRY